MTRIILTLQIIFFVCYAPINFIIWEATLKKERDYGRMETMVKYVTIDELMQMDVKI